VKRQRITLDALARRDNLARALWKAAKGKHRRPAVAAFLADADACLSTLAVRILSGEAPLGRVTRFEVFDPKRREITAACFEDRVLHHAILNLAEARFERALVDTVYACRPGKGVHAAVLAVQRGLQRWPWVVQVDVAGYFASIRHDLALEQLARLFKGEQFLALMGRILLSGTRTPGRGLPIGALTSQHLANHHLGQADRLLQAHPGVGAHVRYMDDVLWCCTSLQAARDSLAALRDHVEGELGLALKPTFHLQPAHRGVRFCGFRVRPGVVLAGTRKLRRARQQARCLHAAEVAGMPECELQRAAAALQAALHPADTARFRRDLWWPQHVTMEAGCSA
jgi:RNA-directed DNA polymerase